ncbi:unnamed protein product [Tenebrio molitor]|nr:unnamed protein product [Tenebrio molitor]
MSHATRSSPNGSKTILAYWTNCTQRQSPITGLASDKRQPSITAAVK